LALAVHRHVSPVAPLAVRDAADARKNTAQWLRTVDRDLDDAAATVVLRHLDLLPPAALPALARVLESAAGRTGWVVGLTAPPQGVGPRADQLVRRSSATEPATDQAAHALARRLTARVTVPPLRHRVDDVAALVPYLLGRQSRGAEVRCTDAALTALTHAPWPGNVRQLDGTLRYAAAHRVGHTIDTADLPPSLASRTQHALTPWESTERDMIIRALLDHGGDRTRAAQSLGISRATIYRKIAAYQIRLAPGGP
jgi:sigma-54 dependent transcriptional regulator, acetoin dehydrogenase operon transcriptional activator AcoR